MKSKSLVILLALALGLGLAGLTWAGGNAGNSTAQSVMFATDMNGDFIMTATQVFAYQPEVAATYFTNAWDKVVPVGQVQGQVHGTTAPAAPPAPAPIDTKLTGSLNGNKCIFFYRSSSFKIYITKRI